MDLLVEQILKDAGPEQSPLPSIRTLAAHFQVSTVTVHKALRKLQAQKKIFCIPNKGFYWGSRRETPPLPGVQSRSKLEQARARLFADFQCGVYHPSDPLPTLKALAQLYQLSPTRMGQLFQHFVHSGILTRRGRNFYLADARYDQSHATVLLVTRCNQDGQLLFSSERETDFIKAFQRERMRLNMRLQVAGWYEDPSGVGHFLDQQGRVFHPQASVGVLLGAVVSTWLMRSPLLLLQRLWTLHIPISLWWEQSRDLFPRPRRTRPSTVGFNISFGQSAGAVVGRYLQQVGHKRIAFISPFHASEWSQNRLEGLLAGFNPLGRSLVEFTDSTFDSAGTIHQKYGIKRGEQKIRQILRSFLENRVLQQEAVWVTVNDHTALLLLEILKEKGQARPYLISFDNSTIAEAHRLDSFEFHTEGMVRQMFYHLQHPGAILYQDQGLHEMVGRLVLRN